MKEKEEGKDPIFFGGGTASAIKRTRTRTRAMMTAISEKIKSVDQVFVVGHKKLDMDGFGGIDWDAIVCKQYQRTLLCSL